MERYIFARPRHRVPVGPGFHPTIRRWAACASAAALGLLTAAAASAQEAGCSEPFMARIQAEYQAIGSFSGRFAQEDRQADGSVVRAAGEIAYVRPGRMRWDYEPPHEQLVVTDGQSVWLFDPLLDNVTVQPLEDVTQGTPLSFLLGVGNLQEDFTCRPLTRPTPDDGLAYLELVPREKIPTLDFLQIGVTPGGAALETLLIHDTQGNVREMRLIGLRRGVTFPPGFFTFTITDEMEVISK